MKNRKARAFFVWCFFFVGRRTQWRATSEQKPALLLLSISFSVSIVTAINMTIKQGRSSHFLLLLSTKMAADENTNVRLFVFFFKLAKDIS